MNSLFIIKKSFALSRTIVLTLAILLSVVGSASARESGAAPDRN